jgi:outer membrane receptor protein involved in Fe transport
VVPRFGLLVRPLRWTGRPWLRPLTLVASLGRSFRYPSFQEMYVRVDGFGGNAELQPEDAVEAELGLRWRRRLLSLELVYFQRRLKNLILFAPVSSFLVRADNYRNARAEGLEAAAMLHAPGNLDLRASYTLTRSRFGDPPMSLPAHPEHRLKARLEWAPPWTDRLPGQWRVQPRLFSAIVVEGATVLGRFESQPEEGRVLLSAGASLGYRGFTLSAEGENLLDKRDAVDAVGFPLPPARFLLSLVKTL